MTAPDQALPEEIDCPHCDALLGLSHVERIERMFECPTCGTTVDLRDEPDIGGSDDIPGDLRESLGRISDLQLYETLDRLEDYTLPYLVSVLGEMKVRGLDTSMRICLDCGQAYPGDLDGCPTCGRLAGRDGSRPPIDDGDFDDDPNGEDGSGVAGPAARLLDALQVGSSDVQVRQLLWFHSGLVVALPAVGLAGALVACTRFDHPECGIQIVGAVTAYGALGAMQLLAAFTIARNLRGAKAVSMATSVVTAIALRQTLVVFVICGWMGLLALRGNWSEWSEACRASRPFRMPGRRQVRESGGAFAVGLLLGGLALWSLDYTEVQFPDSVPAIKWIGAVVAAGFLVGLSRPRGTRLEASGVALSLGAFSALAAWLLVLAGCGLCTLGPFDKLAAAAVVPAVAAGLAIGRGVSGSTRKSGG